MNTAAQTLSAKSPASHLWQQAAAIAAEAHEGQLSPGSLTPYFAHPSRVAMLVSAVFGCHDEEVLAAAYLHDVLEKTPLPHEGLALAMGGNVSAWVVWLTKPHQGDETHYWEGLAKAPWQPRLIKMADALDHLAGPPEDLENRLKTARMALALAAPQEAELQRAASVLATVIGELGRDSESVAPV